MRNKCTLYFIYSFIEEKNIWFSWVVFDKYERINFSDWLENRIGHKSYILYQLWIFMTFVFIVVKVGGEKISEFAYIGILKNTSSVISVWNTIARL